MQQNRSYRMDYQFPGAAAWLRAEESAVVPRYRVVDLLPSTAYVFRVTPRNEFGDGPATSVGPVQTLPAAIPPNAPAQVAGLVMQQPPRVNGIRLAWAPVQGATDYRVRVRPHDGDAPWQDCGTTGGTSLLVTTSGLPPAHRYDVQVAARKGNGAGPWSAVLTVPASRRPQWADLVVRQDGIDEVDVTRVQMLFFTAITAVFVGMKILATYTIPEIPQGFLLLMGISNGIYLTAKFIPD